MASITLTANKSAVMGKNFSSGWNGWNGFENHLQVGATNTYRWRSVVKFPVWELPNNITVINSATLRLTFYSTETPHAVMDGTNQANLKIGRMYADWGRGSIDPGEGNLTANEDWNFDNRSTKFATVKYSGLTDQTATGNTMDIDITEIVNEWHFEGKANYGLIFINSTSESDDAYSFLFYSAETGTAGNRPEIIVDYSVNTAPSAVTNTSPADSSTVNTLTPNFYGEMTDSDGDDITAFRVRVTDSVSGTEMWDSTKVPIGTGSSVAAGNTITVPYGTIPSNTNIEVLPLVAGDTYNWVMTLWDEGDASVASSTYSFTTNALPNAPSVTVTPTPISSVPDSTPNYSIVHNDPDPSDTLMDGYTVVVEEESIPGAHDWTLTWTTGDVDISGSPQSSVNVTSTTLDWGTSYRVYARTQDSNGAWGPYSAPQEFATQITRQPINLTPSGGETVGGTTPTLAGERGDAADTISKFSIRVYSEDLQTAFLAETEYTTGTNGTTFSKVYSGTALVAGDTYKWSAKVFSTIGGYSLWSDWQTFTLEADTSVPTITSPVGDNDYSLTPTITFNRSAAFDMYDVEIYPETATSGNLGTPHDTDYSNSQTSATSASYTYGGTALEWATGYKIRARVSPNGGTDWSSWSGLTWFKTESIDGPPVLVSVEGDTGSPAWINTPSPYFEIQRYSGDANSIDQMQYRIWNASGATMLYDSGMTNVTNSSTAQLEYTAGLLVPGTSYKWDAKYQNDQGPISPWSTKADFRLNGPPTAPTGLFPPSGYVYLSTETKIFKAEFDDPDEGTFGDSPAEWQIMIWNDDTDLQHGSTQSVTVGLSSGQNETTWSGTALATGVNYSWSSRFQDSLGEWGAWSAFQGFRVSTPPNGTITTPSDDSVVSTVTPNISWSITGDQSRYRIKIERTDAVGNFLSTVTTLDYDNTTDTSDSVTLPAGYLLNGNYYDITLTIWNTDNLVDPSPSTVNVEVDLDAPDPVTSIDSYADFTLSSITVYWDLDASWTLSTGHTFVGWRIKRRRKDFTSWETIDDVTAQATKSYTDYYAGHNVNYQYAVYAVTRKSGAGLELVSGDDPLGGNIIEAQLASSDWHFIGEDRSPTHNSILVIEEESHNRPIQQEVFETLGSDRKVIMRGFVLGHEGTISTLWFNTEVIAPEDEQLVMVDTYRGKRIVDYLTRNPGPHIVKSPFGDVWDSQFATPEYRWLPTGHLSVSLQWIETGTTSESDF